MGYSIYSREAKLHISSSMWRAAKATLRRDAPGWAKDERCKDVDIWWQEQWEFTCEHVPDEGEEVVGVSFYAYGGKWTEETVNVLRIIAPFVEAGSYIDMSGEDGAAWRWYFDGKRMSEHHGVIIYPTQQSVWEAVVSVIHGEGVTGDW